MKLRLWIFMFFILAVVSGCSSNEESYAKKLILISLKNTTAIQFVEFTQFDDKNACYEVNIRNYDGREQIAFISLQKDKATDLEWSHWATAGSFGECRESPLKQVK